MRSRRHLRLVREGEHLLFVETSDEYVDVVCSCGKEWGPMPDCFLKALAEHHEAVIYA